MDIYGLLKGMITQEELLNYYNATIDYIKMPTHIHGFVHCHNNTNIITINKNLSYCKKKKTILHELAHIELNQLNQNDKDIIYLKIDKYEDEADKYIKSILADIKENKNKGI